MDRRTHATVVVLALLVFLAPVHHALGQDRWIPLVGYSWPEPTILFHFDDAVSDKARTAVRNAAWIWLVSQQWFIANYEGGQGVAYVFEETSITWPNVILVKTSISMGSSHLGSTTARTKLEAATGRIVPVNMKIDLRILNARGEELDQAILAHVAAHELGHALGLGHSPTGGDLMYEKRSGSEGPWPSTLDLYAVYLIGKGSLVREFSLPPEIPYTTPPLSLLRSEAPRQGEVSAPQDLDAYAYPKDSVFVVALIAAVAISFVGGFYLARARRGNAGD